MQYESLKTIIEASCELIKKSDRETKEDAKKIYNIAFGALKREIKQASMSGDLDLDGKLYRSYKDEPETIEVKEAAPASEEKASAKSVEIKSEPEIVKEESAPVKEEPEEEKAAPEPVVNDGEYGETVSVMEKVGTGHLAAEFIQETDMGYTVAKISTENGKFWMVASPLYKDNGIFCCTLKKNEESAYAVSLDDSIKLRELGTIFEAKSIYQPDGSVVTEFKSSDDLFVVENQKTWEGKKGHLVIKTGSVTAHLLPTTSSKVALREDKGTSFLYYIEQNGNRIQLGTAVDMTQFVIDGQLYLLRCRWTQKGEFAATIQLLED